MKRWVLTFVVAILIVAGVQWLLNGLLMAMNQSKLMRPLSDARSIATALEAFRIETGSYPRTFDVVTLKGVLEPNYIREAALDGVSYYSDGQSYALVVQPFGGTGAVRLPCLEIRNGRIITWPEWAKPGQLRDLSDSLATTKHEADAKLASGREN